MIRLFYTILFLSLFLGSYAQQLLISGKLIDETKQPAIGSSILLLNAKDSSFIKGTTTDVGGLFKLDNTSSSIYIISINRFGNNCFKTKFNKFKRNYC
jgi:hypothetical protein